MSRTCDHPDFEYCTEGASPFVFVFGRSAYLTPTEEQVAEYWKNRKIVEAHGGRMIREEYAIAGDRPRFTGEDVHAAVESVLRSNPDLELDQHWNGEGCLSLSVGCRKRTK